LRLRATADGAHHPGGPDAGDDRPHLRQQRLRKRTPAGHTGGIALLLEYGRLVPLWHDPGSGYTFVPAHLFSVAVRTGRGRVFDR
jgi:hypothetical protein